MQPLTRLLASSTLALTLCLAPGRTQAQAPLDISADLIRVIGLPNAAGAYGATVLADVNIHGVVVGGFGFPTHTLQEGSFSPHAGRHGQTLHL